MAKITRGEFRNPRHHKLAVNIRLKTRGTKPTRAEALDVVREIGETGEVPQGWRFAMISWTHAGEGSSMWRRGKLRDIDGQLQQVWPDLMEKIRVVGIDRAKSGGNVWEVEIALKY